ncbi:MAG: hypothetical protein COV36_02535 [Alphaproteobacteria bacterium CG11_big_fil_rev_8_21_14_0_20_44_7]|nr:MAG: hypothetical protein COV36_02535 [Alphaproteobacteria bacterium CG11_big_fil_rev_8_21_14_0_20_44_7]
MKKLILSTSIIVLTAASANAECANITKDEVIAAQTKWGTGIVEIGKSDNPSVRAQKHLDDLYAYDLGEVLFKPTKAADDQFRGTEEEALSYFVTGIVPEDKGFALAPYTKVRFENEGITIDCDSALAMGNYYFTTTEGNEIKVEYSFGYIEDKDGNLKINLHHSSLPYKN